jgi:hypothetical protein
VRRSKLVKPGDDPRDKIGRNPTGRVTRSSAGKRRKEERKLNRELAGTEWEQES